MKKQVKNLPDTNIIIRYLTRDDEDLYVKAKDFFDEVRDGSKKAIILESVVAESIYVLTKIYKAPRDVSAESLIDILHYKGIVNDDKDELIRALTLFAKKKLDIVDCVLCAKSSKAGSDLFSFDVELNKIRLSSVNEK